MDAVGDFAIEIRSFSSPGLRRSNNVSNLWIRNSYRDEKCPRGAGESTTMSS